MSLIRSAIRGLQDAPAPDPVVRAAVASLVSGAARRLEDAPTDTGAFARAMRDRPIAEHVEAANDQHYELPPSFFEAVLGPHLKYSSCLYRTGRESLAEAERAALEETCEHAGLRDGQTILELGCGWGSLSLWMAQAYPAARITAVSNSAPQRRHIEAKARAQGLTNLTVITADMNVFAPSSAGAFDRIVSVEMFEHMANWRGLLERARTWLEPDGRLFLHVFTHRDAAYRFELGDRADFIAQYFFTGGLMPSHDMPHAFPDLFEVEEEWRWSGEHYRRTADDWLRNMDRHPREVGRAMREAYGDAAPLWTRRWRRFFMATAGLFGHAGGTLWAVGHYRLKPAGAKR